MKRSLIPIRVHLILFCLFLFLSINELGCPAAAKQQRDIFSAQPRDIISRNAFKNKETIKFGAYSKGIKIGSGELIYLGTENLNNIEVQHIVLKVSTFSFVDKENIYGRLDFSVPVKVERNLRFLGRNESIIEKYSPDKRSVMITKRGEDGSSVIQEIKSDEEFGNVLLLIYRLRNDKDMNVGKIYKIVLPTQKFNLIVREKRRIKVPLGSFEAFFLESHPPKYKIWLSSGKEKTPLRIQGLIATGLVYLAAISVDGP